ncbi:MAG: ammonium transporter [Rhodobacteraceae bacterium]|nr:ammonium transporter [Paracoccaceae bacterium]
MKNTSLTAVAIGALALATPSLGWAQDATPSVEPAAHTAYILNTVLFLIGGFLVMWMAAGFAMLEAGLVRTKNVAMQCTKNIALFSIASIMFYLIGYNIMYPGDAWLVQDVIGGPSPKGLEPVGGDDLATGYSASSDFFFQLMFCATTASIVSGTLAERIKLWPFLIFTVLLTGVIYPIEASWEWGAGWLDDMGFSDFAGSTLVHAAGGAAALAGAIILGPRIGKYKDGAVTPMPGSSLPLATLGTFILWLGWFGFNGGSQLAMGTIGDVTDVGRIFVNTNTAAAAGALAALVLTQLMYGKVDLTMVLNGALAGLVSITAEPLAPSIAQSIFIGAVGGLIVVLTVPMLDKLKIDDVVGAIPVHMFAGIWGTIIVPFSNGDADYMTQLIGTASICGFVFLVSFVVWAILAAVIGIRASEEDEMQGLDNSEIGMEAYPEFGKGSQFI